VNQDFRRVLLNINNSGFGCLLSFILIAFLLGSVGLGWVVNSFLVFLALLLATPVIVFWIVRWWLQRNLIEDRCPVCGYEFTGFNQIECRCPNCGELLEVDHGHFQRITPPGTIDIDAIEVPTKRLEN
jgi:4-amino-4-deoxy-L-arabinose transferase-like glycosyltransferase